MDNDASFNDKEYAMEILLHKPKFQQGILALREKWHIPVEGFEDNLAKNTWSEHLTAADADIFEDDLFALLQVLGLSERWQQGVRLYLQTNNPMMLRVQSPGEIKFKHDGAIRQAGDKSYSPRNVRDVWIRVFADSTEREMRDDFQYAKSLFSAPQKKKQKPGNLRRDLEVLKRHNNGESNRVISDWLNEEYGSIVRAFNTDDVAKIIERMKQKLK
ncbi:MAG TPA: hypothetical protein VLG09_05380 [Candidatus Saccharimonadales bacterium]|nr:hypothetical protein [Candidatus Saccharimonadales bacterium]